MTPDEIAAVLRHQRARGPLPSSAEGLSAWIAALQHQLPPVAVELQSQWNAISRLRAAGLVVEEAEGKAILRFPPDGDALDRTFALLGLPPIEGGGAAATDFGSAALVSGALLSAGLGSAGLGSTGFASTGLPASERRSVRAGGSRQATPRDSPMARRQRCSSRKTRPLSSSSSRRCGSSPSRTPGSSPS